VLTSESVLPPADVRLDNAMDTLPKLVRRNAEVLGNAVAVRRRQASGWVSYSWRDVRAAMDEIAAGLIDLGCGKSSTTAIIGGNSPEFFWAEYAAQALGSVTLTLFAPLRADEIARSLSGYDCEVAFAETAEQVSRLQEAADEVGLKAIIYWGTEVIRREPVAKEPALLTLAELRDRGAAFQVVNPGEVDRLIDSRGIDDIAGIIFTSGTTGDAKGAKASYRYLFDIAHRYRYLLGAQPGDTYLSYLPPAFSVEQYCGVTLGTMCPLTLAFPETSATADRDFRASGAQFRYFGPRQWEELMSTVPPEVADDPDAVASKAAELREALGLAHVKGAVNAGGTLSPDVFAFFHRLGVGIRSVYGFAEVGIITGTKDASDFATVGGPLPSLYGTEPIQIRVVDDEIQVRGGVPCSGYWGTRHALADRMTGDGWLRSGDAGIWDGSRLQVIDRLENIRRLAPGRQFAPQPIEIAALRSPYIANILLVGGDDRPSVGALVQVNEAAVRAWLSSRGEQSDGTFAAISQSARVVEDLIGTELAKVNAAQEPHNRIARFANLVKPLSADDGELTRSLKLRRGVVLERYAQLVDALYAGEPRRLVTYEIEDPAGTRRAATFEARIGEVPGAGQAGP